MSSLVIVLVQMILRVRASRTGAAGGGNGYARPGRGHAGRSARAPMPGR